MSRFSVAKSFAVDNLDSLVPDLFGSGRKQTRMTGGRWEVANKWRSGATLDQMSVWRTGAHRGAFKDFAGDVRGDAIDLVAYGLTGVVTDQSRLDAVSWIEERFGIRQMDPARRAEIARDAEKRQAQLAEEAKRRTAVSRRRAQTVYFAAQGDIRGSLVEIYARSRGVDLNAIAHLGHAHRFMPACQYWPRRPRDVEGNAIGPAPCFPAMLSAMVDNEGHVGAVHYTFLEPDGTSKLDTAGRGFVDADTGKALSPKQMYPETAGLVIRIAHGPTGMSCEQAADRGLAGWQLTTEGIEDGWSFALSDPEIRVQAAGSLSGFLNFPDHAAVSGHLLARDNDWDKPQAVAQFDAALARVRQWGKPVEVVQMPPEWGKDGNDVLRMKG